MENPNFYMLYIGLWKTQNKQNCKTSTFSSLVSNLMLTFSTNNVEIHVHNLSSLPALVFNTSAVQLLFFTSLCLLFLPYVFCTSFPPSYISAKKIELRLSDFLRQLYLIALTLYSTVYKDSVRMQFSTFTLNGFSAVQYNTFGLRCFSAGSFLFLYSQLFSAFFSYLF